MKARRTAQKFVDYDYVDKLTDAEREWLQAFTNSHYGNGQLDPPKSKRRREAFTRNNAASRDAMSCTLITLEDAGLE